MKNRLRDCWFTDKLPKVHVVIPKNSGVWVYVLRWFIHPIKRKIAKLYLILLRKCFGLKVIGITGSAGKTTTKEMIAAILRLQAPTVWTKENIDPIYNIPTTILRARPWTKYLILEMGVEYPGEMDFYLWMAKPDIVVITNIFPTHTEFLGSVEGVFREKGKLVLCLGRGSIAVLNRSDSRLKSLDGKLEAKIVWFDGDNADAAATLARTLGVGESHITRGLKNYDRPKHRFEIIKHKSGAVVFDDSYNSNPEAFLTTLKKFNRLAGRNQKVAVIGDMLELGRLEEDEHRRVGQEIAKSNFKTIVGVGKAVRYLLSEVKKISPQTKTHLFSEVEAIPLDLLANFLVENNHILIKGSRSIGLDRVVDKLL